VRMRALGSAPTNTWSVPPPEPEAAPSRETVGRAIVSQRDGKGVPTRLGLPGCLAGKQVALFVRTPDGTRWAGAVGPDGAITRDLRDKTDPRPRELKKIVPGSRITAALDSAGRVLALVASPKK